MRTKALAELARSLMPRTSAAVRAETRPLPGLTVVGYSRPTPIETTFQKPAICLFLQGSKMARFGGKAYELGPGDCWLISHHVSVDARVKDAPSLAILFDLELGTLRALYDELAGASLDAAEAHSFQVHEADPHVVETVTRYLALAGSSMDAQVLGPLIAKEIHYRLVVSPFGGMLRQLLAEGSHASAIAQAIALIRRDFRRPLVVPALARAVGMSPSLFYEQFRSITSSTPLQYQKELRLHEARRLLTLGGTSVASAAYEVGYESASQFSREYARKFGVPPSRHAMRHAQA